MVDITISVSGHQQVSQRLSRLASQMGDLTTANRALSIQLYEWVLKNYDTEGGSIGGWAPLADSTVARKAKLGKEKKLVISGYGRASILPFSDAHQAGIGTPVPYMAYHQEGTSRMPQRRFLPNEEETLSMAIDVYGHYVERVVAEANS